MNTQTKYILVTGGVISGIGKGIVTSSIAALLKACNLIVTAIKIDPYINIDAGTFSPYEHGEVYVLDDGSEVDLDLGNYERALDVQLKGKNNITTGKIYLQVINRERQGVYLGKTVQIIPHITDAIQDWIREVSTEILENSKRADVCIIELGGTIGDIEGMPFIEALRQFRRKVTREDFFSVHVNLVPSIGPSKEHKTKPTQASVGKLRGYGLYPDMIVCRSDIKINDNVRDKISLFCDVDVDRVLSLPDLKTTYSVPIELEKQGILKAIASCLKLNICPCNRLSDWIKLSEIASSATNTVDIALVGKYTALGDCYTSVIKALEHACFKLSKKPLIRYIDSAFLEDDQSDKVASTKAWNDLKSCHGLLVPGGFGYRGIEGKINAIKYARLNKIPFLGICIGFQMAVIEYARNVMNDEKANSAEFASEGKNYCAEPYVIEMLEYQDAERKLGGTMRLGRRKTKFVVGDSILQSLYGADVIEERHRHRYEINPIHIESIEKAGLRFVGKNEDGTRMEILELDRNIHPYFVGTQYHPEYLSRPFKPSPPYVGLINSANKYAESRQHFD